MLVACPEGGLEAPARTGTPVADFIRFMERVPAAIDDAEKHGFTLSGWHISNAGQVFPTVYEFKRIEFRHSCGKSFRLNRRQLEAAADAPEKFRCSSCHAGLPAKDARELMVCLRYIVRGFDQIQHGFMPDLFSCAGMQFVPGDFVFPIYRASTQK